MKKDTKSRLNRLDEIIGLLKECEETTAQSLAKQLNISTRTLMRDLHLLREKGYPIESDTGRGGGIRLNTHYGVGRLMLSFEEVLDLLLAINVIDQLGSPLLLTHLSSLQKKLAMSFPDSYRVNIKRLRKRIRVGESASKMVFEQYPKEFKTKLSDLIHQSFFEQKILNITYLDQNSNQTQRAVEIHYLHVTWPIWYLLVWDHLREDVRCLRLDRISHATISGQAFKLKPVEPFIEGFEQFARPI